MFSHAQYTFESGMVARLLEAIEPFYLRWLSFFLAPI